METLIGLFAVVVIFFVFVAYFSAIGLLITAAQERGRKKTGSLWLIGIFTSPIVLGLCVIALPDKKKSPVVITTAPSNELPPL
jgi:amino acid permease